jgi:hypothetical protein
MVVDAAGVSKKRKDGPALRLVHSFEFKSRRIACGVKGNSEMLEESAAAKETSDREHVGKCGIDMQYMLSDKQRNGVHPHFTSATNTCAGAWNAGREFKAESGGQRRLEHAVSCSGIDKRFEVSGNRSARSPDSNGNEGVVENCVAWPGSRSVGETHYRASGSHAGGVFRMTESVSPIRFSVAVTSS